MHLNFSLILVIIAVQLEPFRQMDSLLEGRCDCLAIGESRFVLVLLVTVHFAQIFHLLNTCEEFCQTQHADVERRFLKWLWI